MALELGKNGTHIIVARDKKTGQMRSFVFSGDWLLGMLFVEETTHEWERETEEKIEPLLPG